MHRKVSDDRGITSVDGRGSSGNAAGDELGTVPPVQVSAGVAPGVTAHGTITCGPIPPKWARGRAVRVTTWPPGAAGRADAEAGTALAAAMSSPPPAAATAMVAAASALLKRDIDGSLCSANPGR